VALDFYNQHISDKGLDIGVGTCYFLDKCRFRSTAPKAALFDSNPYRLAKSTKRLRRYHPSCYMSNALHRIDIGMSGFDSISLNYPLHSLPGNLASKSIVWEHGKPWLREGGGIFGSTILGEGVRHNPLAKRLMRIYNAKGISSNLSDRWSDLEAGFKAHFDGHTIHIAVCVALFSTTRRMARTITGDCRAVPAEVHERSTTARFFSFLSTGKIMPAETTNSVVPFVRRPEAQGQKGTW
jgi:hypothetical protein